MSWLPGTLESQQTVFGGPFGFKGNENRLRVVSNFGNGDQKLETTRSLNENE